MIHVIPPGTRVMVDGEIPAIVTCVSIVMGGAVRYCVEWWNGYTLCAESFDATRITVSEKLTPLKIGYDQVPQ